MSRPRRLRLVVFYEGVWLLICGFFLKMVCADNLAAYVNAHWKTGYAENDRRIDGALAGADVLRADPRRLRRLLEHRPRPGVLLGYRLPLNFNAPYRDVAQELLGTLAVTLSRWLRDYLCALGGNRGSRSRTYVNLLLVMVLGGLWHGAYLRVHRVGRAAWDRAEESSARSACIVTTHAVARRPCRLVPRRAGGGPRRRLDLLPQRNLHRRRRFPRQPRADGLPAAAGMGASAARSSCCRWSCSSAWTWLFEQRYVPSLSPTARAALAAAMTYGIVTLYGGTSSFIYFQILQDGSKRRRLQGDSARSS